MVQPILIKYETKSARVKGLAFHPKRRWILASLHNGAIHLYDYSEKTLIDKFQEHQGPVRGLDFHRNQPLFVSGGDDYKIRLWNYKSRRCICTLGAHDDYIRTTYFHHEHPWIISASDDKTICLWNWQSRSRIAVLAGHADYVMCAQINSSRDLILSASNDQTLRLWNISGFKARNDASSKPSRDEVGLPEILVRADYSVESKAAHDNLINWCSFHPSGNLCLSAADDNYIKVWRIDSRMGLNELYTLRGHYNCVNCAIFHPKANYIVSASEDRSIRIWDLDKRIPIATYRKDAERFWTLAAHPNENLFAAGHDSGLMIFKLERERPKQATIDTFGAKKLDAKHVVTSCDKKFQAYIGPNWIKICDGQLNVLTTLTEQRKIKSAKWDPTGVLIYNTPVHVKYALPDGHCTTILTVHETLYITEIKNDRIICLNRKGETKQIGIDSKEFAFKQAVFRGDRAAIMSSLRKLKQLSRAEISFLVKKGYPGLALNYVTDPKSRFPLGIQAFNINESLNSALKINDRACWKILADAAMKVGHVRAVERALIELKQPYRLAMLYLVCGQRTKMMEARSLAKNMGDTASEFTISLLIKDFAGCVHIIRRNHPNLAYACAVNHGLYELALEISQDLSEQQLMSLPSLEKAYNNTSNWIQTTTPEISSEASFENWPLLNDEEEAYEFAIANDDDDDDDGEPATIQDEGGDWEDEETKLSSELGDDRGDLDEMEDAEEEAGWSDGEPLEDLDDDDDAEETLAEVAQKKESKKEMTKFTPPNPGPSVTAPWCRSSDVALHHVLAGSFKSAFGLLERQVGAINQQLEDGKSNLEMLHRIFKELYLQSRAAYRGSAMLPTFYIYPLSTETVDKHPLPAGGYKIEELEKDLKDCYELVTKGRFKEAIENFRYLLVRNLFLNVTSDIQDSVDRAIEIIGICREYILALQVWGERKRITEKENKEFEDHKRACELAAYFAKLKLWKKHRPLVLEQALKVFRARPKEFQKTQAAAVIARRLLEVLDSNDPKKKDTIAFAERVKASEDIQIDGELRLDYDDKNPYYLCAVTYKPIYKGNPITECPLCEAKYRPDYSSQLCRVCQLSEIGKHGAGLKLVLHKE